MDVDVSTLKQNTLHPVSEEKAFWVCRGDRIDNVEDLANCIESLTPEQFKHHVDIEGHKNDFSQWVFDVLHNPLLARDLNYDINFHDQKHYVKTIRDHVKWLQHV